MTPQNTHLRRCGVQPVPDRHSRRPYLCPTTARGYRRSAHVVSAPHAHLASVTKHRRGVLTAEHITHLRDAFTKACGEFNATLDE